LLLTGVVVVVGGLAAWNARGALSKQTGDTPQISIVPVEKSAPLAVSTTRSDSTALPTAIDAPSAKSTASVSGRERRVDSPKAQATASRREPSGPIASAPPSDPIPVAAPTTTAGDTSANRIEPVSPPAPQPLVPSTGLIQIGTHESGVVLFVNGRPDGPLTRLKLIRVPVGTVRLQLRAEQCQAWDSTVTVRGGDTPQIIGYRQPQC
jgi:hypothetical protein